MKAARMMPQTQPIPRHLAIIMDGNGRWAKARGLPRTAGHKKGADALSNLLPECRRLGIKYLTVYAFSSENWNRPEQEISDLMQLLRYYLEREIKTLHKEGVRLRIIGDVSQLEPATRKQIAEAECLTKDNTVLTFIIALSYGGRREIAQAAQRMVQDVAQGTLTPQDIDEKRLGQYLYTSDLPDPDLLIRTGGEQRLSNFLLWQQAYTELFFTDTLWPDFNAEHLQVALHDFAKRDRRYGNTNAT